MTILPGNTDLITSVGVGTISVVGAISKSTQWRDTKTGKMSLTLVFSGIATCLIMASIVRAAGVQWGIEPWAQVMASGVLCYVGPDPVIRAVAGLALKRIGVQPNDNANDTAKS